jgi:hypothetical protein
MTKETFGQPIINSSAYKLFLMYTQYLNLSYIINSSSPMPWSTLSFFITPKAAAAKA